MGHRYRRMEGQKPRPRFLLRIQNFAKGGGLEPKVEMFLKNALNW